MAVRGLADFSMLDLFRVEAETQLATLTDSLVALEKVSGDSDLLETAMRAAHSMKGAARMVGLEAAVGVAHCMEDVLVAVQNGDLLLDGDRIDVLLRGVDTLHQIATATASDCETWVTQHAGEIEKTVAAVTGLLGEGKVGVRTKKAAKKRRTPTKKPRTSAKKQKSVPTDKGRERDGGDVSAKAPGRGKDGAAGKRDRAKKGAAHAVRVSADSLDRLMGLAGEVSVETGWLQPFRESLLRVKKRQTEFVTVIDQLRDAVADADMSDTVLELFTEARRKAGLCRQSLSERMIELEEHDRRATNLASRLHREAVASRMRPFADGITGFPRLVRDLARSLGKKVALEIHGHATQVDRDILEKVEAPLNHLLRNAVDHGIESPEERLVADKPAQGTIRLEAAHHAGMLSITVADDGRGVNLKRLRERVIAKGMVTEEMAVNLSETELMDFLFLPGFSTRGEVTEVSGRGVGLDVVHSVLHELRGIVRAVNRPGKGVRFHLQLPLTLSVVRSLLVDIAGEPYAFPLARIERTLKLPREAIESVEGSQYFTSGGRHIGIVTAHQVLELEAAVETGTELSVVILGDRTNSYGVVVDCFLGERSLVVHPLDPRIGKVQDVNAASLMEDGTPLLILDVDDLLRSIDILVAGGRLDKVGRDREEVVAASGKRILVVDDSITVRETERNMLETKGYQVEVAIDGMDAWNAVRTTDYDMVVTDIDMPRRNGIELVGLLKGDERFKELPVIIVSYKDRKEDRIRGLEAGADYYLTKGSFQDETLVEAVRDLIGEA